MTVLPFLRFLFYHLPKTLFQFAGIVRILKRGERAFKGTLKKEGLPEDVVNVLVEEFSVDINWRELLKRDI